MSDTPPPTTAAPATYRVCDEQPFRGQTRRMKFLHQDRYLAALIFTAEYPTHLRLKPEVLPLCTPSGIPATASHQYCFIHHYSAMVGHGKVKNAKHPEPVDFYRHLPHADPERIDPHHGKVNNLYHIGPSGIQKITEASSSADDDGITVNLSLTWQTRERGNAKGDPMLHEKRTYRFFIDGNSTVLDIYSSLRPVEIPTTLVGDRHSYFGVRVNDLIDVEDGGTMRDGLGRVNQPGFYGGAEQEPAARWVDVSGMLGPNPVGVTLISHPDNLRNHWYVPAYGLLTVSSMLNEPVELTTDEPFRGAARFVVHDGEVDPEITDKLADAFAAESLETYCGE